MTHPPCPECETDLFVDQKAPGESFRCARCSVLFSGGIWQGVSGDD